MSLPNGPFIFISYANEDASFVHLEVERLERQGYRVWYDEGELEPTLIWADEISKAITACAYFMVFITEDSVLSVHVCEEIEQALREKKPLIAVYWDNVELPAYLQIPVRQIQTLDRYQMHQPVYEERLSKALSERVRVPLTPRVRKEVISLPPIPPTPDILPKVVFFGLVAVAVCCLFFAVLLAITPLFVSKSTEELTTNSLMGLITAGFFVVISLGLSGGALAVFRIYLRSDK
ncbi:MAG TPA: toll/interleukin-1 receptor domain-containing protein [Pyrinomonadaceae bacterium]|nr:toll/interleukin-1 receptor domain-containing protein [Pyrinomonadaceae bacterium]